MIDILYDCFKHWSKTGSVYLYSDPHFGDAEIFEIRKFYGNVPAGINTVEELDEYQIKQINSFAHKSDTLICLGDVGDIEYVKRLKAGHKILITGNHDRGADYYRKKYSLKLANSDLNPEEYGLVWHTYEEAAKYVQVYKDHFKKDDMFIESDKLFDEVYTGPLMISDKIILSHEPIVPLPDYLINLHGHNHDQSKRHPLDERWHRNFCAEVIRYTPVSLSELIKKGMLSKVADIHRVTIDNATYRKSKKLKKTV